MKPINKKTTLAIMLALLLPAYSFAADFKDEEGKIEDLTYGNRTFITMMTPKPSENAPEEFKTSYDIASSDSQYAFIYDGVKKGVDYWGKLLAPQAKNKLPWQIMLTTNEDANAYASPKSIMDGEEILRNLVAENIQTGTPTLAPMTGNDDEPTQDPLGYSHIVIGSFLGAGDKNNLGWHVDEKTILTRNEEKADLVGTVRHELGHALGIVGYFDYLDASTGVDIDENEYNDLGVFYREHEEGLYNINGIKYAAQALTASDISPHSWNEHLIDQNQNPAAPGKKIVTTAIFEELRSENPQLTEKDFFIVDNQHESDFASDNPAAGFAYFVGENVSDALGTATFNGISGLPVNAWERASYEDANGSEEHYYNFEGSHLNTPGMMSHRNYTNYTSFLEVELAAMQDLGYKIDRKALYGRSIYGDGETFVNEDGFSARNAEGTAFVQGKYSEVPLGVGLHIFGSENTITQKGNILTRGDGAAGIRVDGIENKLNVAEGTEIHADGERGLGILVAYGRNHEINIDGKITAQGEGGNALLADFGSSSNGARDEYRGSYMRYERSAADLESENPGAIAEASYLPLQNDNKNSYNYRPDELEGELVSALNIKGKLSGAENAILIGKNAFVKEINILDGAELKGNITSAWKHFYDENGEKDPIYNPQGSAEADDADDADAADDADDAGEAEDGEETEGETGSASNLDPLYIQYNNTVNDWDAYIPDLVTEINFAGKEITYDGDINGNDNLKLNIKSGTVTFGGEANVVSVTVDEGATLLGGSYRTNNLADKLADGFEDASGVFTVKGSIGAADAESNMKINGTLALKEGATLLGYANAKDKGIIEHTAAQAGDVLAFDGINVKLKDALPGDEGTVLTSDVLVMGTTELTPQSALLSVIGRVGDDNQSIIASAQAADNLGERTELQEETAGSMIRMAETYHDDEAVEVLRPLFNMDADAAKLALDKISANETAATNIRLAQQSTLVHDTLGGELNTLGKNEEVNTGDKLWLKLGKNWGNLRTARGSASYHGSSIVAGLDFERKAEKRSGIFFAYNKANANYDGDSAKLHDTRLGYYANRSKDAKKFYYYGDLGYQHTKTKRALYEGLVAEGKPESYLAEIGGEYKYDLSQNKTWHIAPYAGLTASLLKQKAYTESGAGLLSQRVDEKWNTYIGMQGGVELARALKKGSYGMRVGVLESLAGANPDFSISYVGDSAAHTYSTKQDRTQLVLSLNADTELAHGWSVSGEALLHRGKHDKDTRATLQIKKSF